MITSPGASGWVAPSPEDLPDLRIEMSEQVVTHPHGAEFWMRIVAGSTPLVPAVPGPPKQQAAAYALGGAVMARSEERRLREAQLYWVDEDMTSLALAAAATPPQEPVKARRMPAEAGLMLFAQPIGGHDMDVSASVTGLSHVPVAGLDEGLRLTLPVVAVSWSTWCPAYLELDVRPGKLQWSSRSPDTGLPAVLPNDFQGVWLTFWTTGTMSWDMLPPDKPITTNQVTGQTLTAGNMAARETRAGFRRLKTYDERILQFNQPLPPVERDTSSEWAQVVYTAWQMMGQTGSAQLTETQTVLRRRPGQRRDTRANIPTPGTVNVVRVHTRHRPSADARAQDAAASHSRRAPNWTHRWPVRPYRRNTCLNPHTHADGGCEHDERVVPGHIRGPADKPLVLRDNVHLWDTPPPTK